MRSKKIYVEGGGDRSSDISCREGFSKLLENAGLPRSCKIIPCGSRNDAFDDFKTAHNANSATYVALIVDSEDPVKNFEEPIAHLISRDPWEMPLGVSDEQIFMMTTSMETWIVADRDALKSHFKNELNENALTPLFNLENRERDKVFASLKNSTRTHKTPYAKGKHSYDLLEKLDPEVLKRHLPAFARMVHILSAKLK